VGRYVSFEYCGVKTYVFKVVLRVDVSGDVGLEVGVELDGGREEVEHDGQQLPTTLQAVPTVEGGT